MVFRSNTLNFNGVSITESKMLLIVLLFSLTRLLSAASSDNINNVKNAANNRQMDDKTSELFKSAVSPLTMELRSNRDSKKMKEQETVMSHLYPRVHIHHVKRQEAIEGRYCENNLKSFDSQSVELSA